MKPVEIVDYVRQLAVRLSDQYIGQTYVIPAPPAAEEAGDEESPGRTYVISGSFIEDEWIIRLRRPVLNAASTYYNYHLDTEAHPGGIVPPPEGKAHFSTDEMSAFVFSSLAQLADGGHWAQELARFTQFLESNDHLRPDDGGIPGARKISVKAVPG